MRSNRSTSIRLASVAAVFALAVAVIAPTAAFASLPVPPTIVLSTTYQATAARLKVSGRLSSRTAGKHVQIQIKKPGRDYWDTMTPNDTLIHADGTYGAFYTPMLAGRFFVRSRYTNSAGGSNSRVVSFTVKKGPGVKYEIVMESTTSTRDSGLIEALLPAFLHACPEYSFKGVYVGSGAAIANSRKGDGDVLLAHSPADELKFMDPSTATIAAPYTGKTRYKVMYNDFVLVGPTANPAVIAGTDTAVMAFGKIASTASVFWSRNDNSGTNAKEKDIWKAAGVKYESEKWYQQTGLGMGQTLAVASSQVTRGRSVRSLINPCVSWEFQQTTPFLERI